MQPTDLSVDANKRAHVERILRVCKTRTEACEALGINRSTLFRWLNRWRHEDERKRRGQLPYIPLTEKARMLQDATKI